MTTTGGAAAEGASATIAQEQAGRGSSRHFRVHEITGRFH
jgi:hypothetical protein